MGGGDLMKEFKVYPREIPEKMTIYLSETEKCIFADLLTKFGFGADIAGDTFHHLYRKGLERVHREYFEE
jgi:hypothetical protein